MFPDAPSSDNQKGIDARTQEGNSRIQLPRGKDSASGDRLRPATGERQRDGAGDFLAFVHQILTFRRPQDRAAFTSSPM